MIVLEGSPLFNSKIKLTVLNFAKLGPCEAGSFVKDIVKKLYQ